MRRLQIVQIMVLGTYSKLKWNHSDYTTTRGTFFYLFSLHIYRSSHYSLTHSIRGRRQTAINGFLHSPACLGPSLPTPRSPYTARLRDATRTRTTTTTAKMMRTAARTGGCFFFPKRFHRFVSQRDLQHEQLFRLAAGKRKSMEGHQESTQADHQCGDRTGSRESGTTKPWCRIWFL